MNQPIDTKRLATIVPFPSVPSDATPFDRAAPQQTSNDTRADDVSGFSVVASVLQKGPPVSRAQSPLTRHTCELTAEEAAGLDMDLAMICATRDPMTATMLEQFSQEFVARARDVIAPVERPLLDTAQAVSAEFAFDLARALIHRNSITS